MQGQRRGGMTEANRAIESRCGWELGYRDKPSSSTQVLAHDLLESSSCSPLSTLEHWQMPLGLETIHDSPSGDGFGLSKVHVGWDECNDIVKTCVLIGITRSRRIEGWLRTLVSESISEIRQSKGTYDITARKCLLMTSPFALSR
jgi:hypothetical protein